MRISVFFGDSMVFSQLTRLCFVGVLIFLIHPPKNALAQEPTLGSAHQRRVYRTLPPVKIARVGHETFVEESVNQQPAATHSAIDEAGYQNDAPINTPYTETPYQEGMTPYQGGVLAPPQQSHRILVAPQQTRQRSQHPGGLPHGTSPSFTTPNSAAHGQHSGQEIMLHGRPFTAPGVTNDPGGVGPGRLGLGEHWIKTKPQSRAAIPGATVQPQWKTPYSYGYFGAQGKRQWTRQHGYRDRYLQWTLR